MNKITVIHHSADFDGIFCREIARKFLPGAELIGWTFGDAPIIIPPGTEMVYVFDLPCDQPFGHKFNPDDGANMEYREGMGKMIWIDHHKTSIESHPKNIPGYRIDGVAACRLAWHWFICQPAWQTNGTLAGKEDFFNRIVSEPWAVRLAGEYDIWDKRDPNAELFQFGLKSQEIDFKRLISGTADSVEYIAHLLNRGRPIEYARGVEYAEVIKQQGFDLQWEGLTFLVCNSHELDIRSQLFEAGIKPEHDGLLGFTFNGKGWDCSLYGVPGKPEIDLSVIAKKYGGGGHKQACAFRCNYPPFWIGA